MSDEIYDQTMEFDPYEDVVEALRPVGFENVEPAPEFNVRQAVLGAALAAVTQDRQTNYDTPESNFGLIADLWTAYKRVDFTPDDVAAMQILLKLARHKNAKHLDNAVDIAGYAACMAEVDFRD